MEWEELHYKVEKLIIETTVIIKLNLIPNFMIYKNQMKEVKMKFKMQRQPTTRVEKEKIIIIKEINKIVS